MIENTSRVKFLQPITYEPIFNMVMLDDDICKEFMNLVLAELILSVQLDDVSARDADEFIYATTKDTAVGLVYHGRDYYEDLPGFIMGEVKDIHRILKYRLRKTTYVIAVCMADELEEGEPVLVLKHRLEEIPGVTNYKKYNDIEEEVFTIVLNLSYDGEKLSGDLKAVFDYFTYGIVTDDCNLVNRMDDMVRQANLNGDMYIEFYERNRRNERNQKIRKDVVHGIVRRMLKKGYSVEEIKEIADISAKDIESIRKEST